MAKGNRSRQVVGIGIGVVIVGLLVYGFMPPAVDVDLATITEGPLTVFVEEDGKTRVRERYIVASPLEGRLLRTSLHSGDIVVAGTTVVATIEASDVTLLDDRARSESEARLKAAEAHREQSKELIERARDAAAIAGNELNRAEALLAKTSITTEAYEEIRLKYRLANHDLRVAEFNQTIAEFERDQAKAAFVRFADRPEDKQPLFRHEMRAPISGRVFRVFEENASPVIVGARLIELGDPADLEVEIDVLSSDAVRVKPGAKVWLKHWGGDAPLEARVRVVEPSAFTKISALGIEEQRVWVIADIMSPPEKRTTLGDGYRIEASIVTWDSPKVVKVPAGALFRRGNDWVVYRVQQSRASLQVVQVGHSNGSESEVLEGLEPGEQVILHPSDRVYSGASVIAR
ncbi:MAG: HlyD family efflux transporter periplasmic adaptor subunit [Planctomycetes bacterium]|nr:HlyD family efflux transporter periplasmic adaptor subunit [Planctomycetota bacterium]